MKLKSSIGGIAIVGILLVAAVGGAGALTYTNLTQNPAITADTTVATHQMTWGSPMKYEGDNGNVQTLDAVVNDTGRNPYSFTVTDVNASDFGKFPHAKDGVSALDQSEWTTAGGMTVTSTTTAPGVDAVEIATNGSVAAGQEAEVTFSNFSIASDQDKRYLQVAMDVNTLDSGAVMEVRAVDGDGDYKAAEVNTSRSSGTDLIANATGEGYVLQRQVGKMTTTSAGDGSFDGIEKVVVRVEDGDATVDVSALNLDKMSPWTLGSREVKNAAGDWETETITQVNESGDISVTGLDTLGSTFDDAVIHDLTFPAEFQSSNLPSADVDASFTDAQDYPSFDFKVDLYYRMSLPTAYDLSYSNTELGDKVKAPSNRYQTVEEAEGVSDTEFADIADSSWTSKKSLYDSQGDNVTIDNTIQPGQEIAMHYQYLLTSEEKQAMAQSGVVGGPMGSSGGGLGSWPIIGGLVVFLGGIWTKIKGLW